MKTYTINFNQANGIFIHTTTLKYEDWRKWNKPFIQSWLHVNRKPYFPYYSMQTTGVFRIANLALVLQFSFADLVWLKENGEEFSL